MNDDMDRWLSLARAHDLARDRAQALRRAEMLRFWAGVDEALAQAAEGAGRSLRRLRARLERRAAARGKAARAGC